MHTAVLRVYIAISCRHPIHLQDSTGELYVEVVLHGNTEGQFLEDPRAHCKGTIGNVSKLGKFW